MTNIELLERLAGPIATIIASIAAVTVTLTLGLIQARIARSQANTAEAQRQIARAQLEIAYDRLKHDLFERRFAVYTTAHQMIDKGVRSSNPPLWDHESIKLGEKLGESRFLFPQDIQEVCGKIQRLVYQVDEELRPKETEELRIALVKLRNELPERFARDLSLEQLTRKVGVDEEYEWWRAKKPRS
jgi:hypothetical protein